jgi:hypothetical protein
LILRERKVGQNVIDKYVKNAVFKDMMLCIVIYDGSSLMFWKNIFPPSLGSECMPNKLSWLGVCFNPEDGGNTFLRNVDEHLSNYMPSHSRR